jgi:hypothetical protein
MMNRAKYHAMSVSDLIARLEQLPHSASVRIFDTELCPDADYYITSADYDVTNEANEVTLFVTHESKIRESK